jgi:glycosidase
LARPLVAQEADLVLEPSDADVWAWRLDVRGRWMKGAALRSCSVVVYGAVDAVYPARIEAATFSANVPLSEGENLAQARCLTSSGELRSRQVQYTVRLRATPRAHALAMATDGQLVLDGSQSRPNEQSRAPLVAYAWYEGGALGAPAHELVAGGQRALLPVPSRDGEHVFQLQVSDAHGRSDWARVHVRVRGRSIVEIATAERPTRLVDTVLYGVVPHLYGEPPLRSVIAKLPDLAELGVTALWLSPVFSAPEDDYGYAVTDYFAVREDLGTARDLAELVARAHELGLRVLLDIVPNHTSNEHPYFVQTASLGARSHYFGYYDRGPHGGAMHYFDWTHLPNLDYDNVEVQRFMIAAAEYWMRSFAVDGYRVDAVWGVVARKRDVLREWTSALFRARPDALLIAEGSARDPYYVTAGFTAAYDWTEQPGHWAWQDVFEHRPGIARRLNAAIATHSPPDRVLRFLNNNDTGARFITRHGEAMTRVATAALLTLPGVPCLFSFDEVGAAFEPYQATEPLEPRANEPLRAWHARLIALRKARPALHGAGFLPLYVGERDELYAFLRTAGRDDSALVALNFSDRPASVRIALPSPFAQQGVTRLRDALSGHTVTVHDGTVLLEVQAFGAHVLEP